MEYAAAADDGTNFCLRLVRTRNGLPPHTTLHCESELLVNFKVRAEGGTAAGGQKGKMNRSNQLLSDPTRERRVTGAGGAQKMRPIYRELHRHNNCINYINLMPSAKEEARLFESKVSFLSCPLAIPFCIDDSRIQDLPID